MAAPGSPTFKWSIPGAHSNKAVSLRCQETTKVFQAHKAHIMSYTLQAFIIHSQDKPLLRNAFASAVKVELDQNITLIPLTQELFISLNDATVSKKIKGFDSLTEVMEKKLLQCISQGTVAYVEADYFGGRGGQSAILWKDGKRALHAEAGPGNINKVLEQLGVIAPPGIDAFDTLLLGRYKKTEHWVR